MKHADRLWTTSQSSTLSVWWRTVQCHKSEDRRDKRTCVIIYTGK